MASGTFTWPTNPTWTFDSTSNFYITTINTNISGLTSSSTPTIDVLINTVDTKDSIEKAWRSIIEAETVNSNGVPGYIKFYSKTNLVSELYPLNGVTILVSGY